MAGLRLEQITEPFPSRVCIFQINNVAGLGDQPGDFHMKRCFLLEINNCYYSLTLFFPPREQKKRRNGGNQINRMQFLIWDMEMDGEAWMALLGTEEILPSMLYISQ